MRTYLILTTLALLSFSAQAQTERGSKLIGLSAGRFTYTDRNADDNSFNADVFPSVGWFVADRLAIGTELRLSYARYRSGYLSVDGPVKSTVRTWGTGLAPFVRYYFLDASKHKLFAQATASYTRYMQRNTTEEVGRREPYSNSFSYNRSSWSAGMGYNYFVTPNVALEARVGYLRDRQANYLTDRAQGSLDVRLGFSVFLLPDQSLKGN